MAELFFPWLSISFHFHAGTMQPWYRPSSIYRYHWGITIADEVRKAGCPGCPGCWICCHVGIVRTYHHNLQLGVLSPSHRERCFPWCNTMWLAESTSGMSWILWPKTFIDISILSHRYQTGCFVMISTLGWTPRVSKKKNEDFVSQKLVKLFPSCWQERKDVAPLCKPARNHNVQIDSLGFAHCLQVLPNYITNLLRDGYNAIPSQWVPVEL